MKVHQKNNQIKEVSEECKLNYKLSSQTTAEIFYRNNSRVETV